MKTTILILITILGLCIGVTKAEELPPFVQYCNSIAAKSDAGDADAMGIVADMSFDRIFPGGTSRAATMAQRSADKGSPIGKYSVGCYYYNTAKAVKSSTAHGTECVKEALPGIKVLANNGNMYAQTILGWVYLFGQAGLPKDEAKGIAELLKAANNGFAPAQWTLTSCYADGIGVAVDLDIAKSWLKKAAEAGHPTAELTYKNVGKYLGYRVLPVVPVRVFVGGVTMKDLNPPNKRCVAAYFQVPRFPFRVFSVMLLIGNVPPSPEGSSCTVDHVEGLAYNDDTDISISQNRVENVNLTDDRMRLGPLVNGTTGPVCMYDTPPHLFYGEDTWPTSIFDAFHADYPKFVEWTKKAHELNPEPFIKKMTDNTTFIWKDSQAYMRVLGMEVKEDQAAGLVSMGKEIELVKQAVVQQINQEFAEQSKARSVIENNFK